MPLFARTVPELSPKDVGVPLPIDPHVAPEAYTYDYIIVGGGTAGCCLASRLSEDPDVSVLLIERGPVADTWASRVPLISGNPYRDGSLAARWWALPMRHVDGRSQEVMRGEGLGGTSRINSMLYTRGPPGDYNNWEALGNAGWSYVDLEPYFSKSETTHSQSHAKHRGKHGPWQNRTFDYVPYRVMSFVERATKKEGFTRVADLNAPTMPAAGHATLDICQDANMQRHSTYHAFLPPELTHARRERLKICTNTLVTRVVFESRECGEKPRAGGVHLEAVNSRHASFTYFVKARREVVLCAGALGSPQILQLSGLGPKTLLEEKGVSVLRDMPGVGSNLKDHIGVPLTYESAVNDSLHALEINPMKAVKELVKYLITGGGLFSTPFQASNIMVASRLVDDEGRLVVNKDDPTVLDASDPAKRPDLEIMPIANNCTDHNIAGKDIFTILVAHVRPKSFGSVRITSTNPRVPPDVDLGYFTDQDDYVALRKGLRLALRLAENVRQDGYPLGNIHVPDGTSDAELDAFTRSALRTCYHYTSTCRMGPESEAAHPGVVDTELRVHGVEGLRVCDTSVFPDIVAAHTAAPAVMIAERCADFIKAARH